MRNAGTQLRPLERCSYSPKGIVFGAIIPAIHAIGRSPKKKPSMSAGHVHTYLSSGVDAANGSSKKKMD